MQAATPLLVYAIAESGMTAAGLSQTSTPDDALDWMATLGPFSVAIGLSYYLLKRSDDREQTAEKHHLERERELRDDLVRTREELAVAEAAIVRLRHDLKQVNDQLQRIRDQQSRGD